MTKKTNSVVEAILEMADDQLRSGLIDKAEHETITVSHTPVTAVCTYATPKSEYVPQLRRSMQTPVPQLGRQRGSPAEP